MRRNTTNNLWSLPKSIYAGDTEIPIRTDFRVVLDLLTALSDPDMEGETKAETNEIKAMLMTEIMIPDCEKYITPENAMEVIQALSNFIDMDNDEISHGKPQPRVMDWEQDARLIIPAVNKVVGHDIRSDEYVHWWTFLAAYLEIGECTFSHILSLRQKKAKGKKLEKYEQDFIRENKNLVYLKERKTEQEEREDREEREALRRLIYGDRK